MINFILVFILSFIFGCATNNSMGSNLNNRKEIREGMTYAEIIHIWGEPNQKELLDDGKEIWTYKPFLALYSRKLVLFQNGKVVDHEVQFK
jgi:hypothetical protein